MPKYLTPAILAVVGGVTCWLVSHNVGATIGVVIGGLIGGWMIEKRKAEEADQGGG